MERSGDDIAHWAEKNGYEFKENSDGPTSAGAAELDSFRSPDEITNHITGVYRNRPFEMVDVSRRHESTNGRVKYSNQTLLLLPNEVAEVPDFEIVPHSYSRGLAVLGHGGVTLDLSPDAHRETCDQVTAFNESYRLYAGGVLESGAELLSAATSDESVSGENNLARLNSICNSKIFQFLAKNTGWYIELEGTYLIIWMPGKALSSEQRTEMLQVGNELLKLIQQSIHEQPIHGLTLTQTPLNKKRIFATLIGGAAGFFLGVITSFVLAILVHKLFVLGVPVFAFGGAAIGGLLANRFFRNS